MTPVDQEIEKRMRAGYRESTGREMSDDDFSALIRMCDNLKVDLTTRTYSEARAELIERFQAIGNFVWGSDWE